MFIVVIVDIDVDLAYLDVWLLKQHAMLLG